MLRVLLLVLLTLNLTGCSSLLDSYWGLLLFRALALLAFIGLFVYIRLRRLGHNEGKGGRNYPDYDEDED